MSSTLARIEVRLPAEFKDELTVIAKTRGVSLSEMAVAALQLMLEGPAPVVPPVREDTDRLRHLEQLLETFIKTYLSITPEVPEGQKPAAAARGVARWRQFQGVLQRQEGRA